MTGSRLSTLVVRLAAAITLLRGVAGAAAVLGLGSERAYEKLATAEQARIVAALLADLAAGTALWLLAPWGVVIWSANAAIQGVLAAVSGHFLLCALHLGLAAAVLLAVRHAGRARKNDTFRFS